MTGDRDIVAVLFDIDGTLIITDGAGATSCRLAFEELYGIPADIGASSRPSARSPKAGESRPQTHPPVNSSRLGWR